MWQSIGIISETSCETSAQVKDRVAGLEDEEQIQDLERYAAGVAALMLSANPELNVWDIKSLMQKTCQDLGDAGWDPVYRAGVLQALEAVRAAKTAQARESERQGHLPPLFGASAVDTDGYEFTPIVQRLTIRSLLIYSTTRGR